MNSGHLRRILLQRSPVSVCLHPPTSLASLYHKPKVQCIFFNFKYKNTLGKGILTFGMDTSVVDF